METIIGKDAWEMEDYLQGYESSTGRPVFCWMMDEMSSRHTDSYGTCLNYKEFLEAYDKSTFTKEQWLDSAKYWYENPNCGRPLRIIGLFLIGELKAKS